MKHCNQNCNPKVLHTCGPTSPMPPGVPDSPFDHEKKVAFAKTVKPQGHMKTIYIEFVGFKYVVSDL